MKTKITLFTIAVSTLVLMACGCTTPASIVRAMGKDPASVHVKVSTIYGTIEVTRANPSTNTPPHSVSNDGAIKVDK